MAQAGIQARTRARCRTRVPRGKTSAHDYMHARVPSAGTRATVKRRASTQLDPPNQAATLHARVHER
eukprot:9347911-Alexandrium_andersonii.AAC.1